ncbi:MAG: hypothetical protein HKN62_12125, partial [Phycisphaerales bacterium]|nr:hypothetical protein [Phycisphaerales bacterium]
PAGVARTLAAAGARVVRDVPARDHQPFTRAGLERLAAGLGEAEALVVTGKDWVKMEGLIDFRRWPVPIVVPELDIDVWQGAEALLSLVRDSLRPPTDPACPPS